MSNITDYLTVKQAAASLGVSHSQILNLLQDGRLTTLMFGGSYCVDAAEVAEYKRTRRPPGRPKTLRT